MNFERGLKPTTEMIEAARVAKEKLANWELIRKQVNAQRKLVNDLSKKINDLVQAKKWQHAETPQEVIATKRECSDAGEQHIEETEVLQAFEIALANTHQDYNSASAKVDDLVKSRFMMESDKVEKKIRGNLDNALLSRQ
jgi:hypothetical protein